MKSNNNKAKLIKALEEYRLINSITQNKIADIFKVHRVTVTRWLNGSQLPNSLLAYKIKEFLKDKNV